jgi:hypothetical protein
MPLAGVGAALGKKAFEKVADAVGDAAVDSVKAHRAKPRKKTPSGKAKNKSKRMGWIVLLAIAAVLLFALFGRHLR